jgi:hypothetical protein
MDFKYFSKEDWESVKCKQGIIQSKSYTGEIEEWDYLGMTDDPFRIENYSDELDTPIPNYVWFTDKYSSDNKSSKYVILHKAAKGGTRFTQYTPRNSIILQTSGAQKSEAIDSPERMKFRCVPDPYKLQTLPSLYSRSSYKKRSSSKSRSSYKKRSLSKSRSRSRSRSQKSSIQRCPNGSRRNKFGQCKKY